MANSYTTFPDSVQRFDLKTDISSSVYADWRQFNTYIANGQFANASTLLQNNTELQKCIIDSIYVNQLSKTVEEVQDLFLNKIQTYIHETVVNKGAWNATTKYIKYNFVTYPVNGIIQTFECLRDDTPVATLPTNSAYWVPRIIQGEQGTPGIGLTPRGVWNETALYLVDNFVAYDNSFWQCLNQNSNSTPTDTNTNWLRIANLSEVLTRAMAEFRTGFDTQIATINSTLANKSNSNHTHLYAASTTAGGVATSATKATQDGNGNNIVNTYAPKASPAFTGTPTVAANTSYTTNMVRNIQLTTVDPGEGVASTLPNGSIIIVYE